MRITYPTFITVTALSLLTACATNTASQAKTEPQTNATATTATTAQTATAPAQADSTPAPFNKGAVAEFSKTETKLDKTGVANISQNIEAFKQAKTIEVIGYCDRKDNMLGAQQVALARASAVRAELIKQGVSSNKIRLKYFTAEARHGVSVLLK